MAVMIVATALSLHRFNQPILILIIIIPIFTILNIIMIDDCHHHQGFRTPEVKFENSRLVLDS